MAEVKEETITTYKGFDKDLACVADGNKVQYAVGETVEHAGPVVACKSGLHACEYPLDVLRYRAPADSRYAVVEQSGTLARHDEDSKVASSRLTVKSEIGIADLIKAAVEYTLARAKPIGAASNSAPSGAATNSGYYGAASNSGDSGAASNSGPHGCAADFSGTGKARSSAGGAIFLTRRDGTGAITHVFASKVGENGIKADVWYELGDDGAAKEVGN